MIQSVYDNHYYHFEVFVPLTFFIFKFISFNFCALKLVSLKIICMDVPDICFVYVGICGMFVAYRNFHCCLNVSSS